MLPLIISGNSLYFGGVGEGLYTIFSQLLQIEDMACLSETFVAEQVNTCRAKLTLALVCLSTAHLVTETG